MNKLGINFQNCYGIEALEFKFNFSNKKTFAIYASNGTMKTSFAKTFMDLSNQRMAKDLVYPEKETIMEIKKDGNDLSFDEVFVVEPYNEKYKSNSVSSLLINEKLKVEFDKQYENINKEKSNFLKQIKLLSGLKAEVIEIEICKLFHQSEKGKFFESLLRIKGEVLDSDEPSFLDVKYSELFNAKTAKLLEDDNFIKNIDEYVRQYNQLLEKSTFFKKGVFNHTQAADVATQLDKNGFFQAEHKIILRDKTETITEKKELEAIINHEKDQILEDPDLKRTFDKLDAQLKKNQDLKSFREYLANNNAIVAELKNIESFKAKLWKSYFKIHKSEFAELTELFIKSKGIIEKIQLQAEHEKGAWFKVIEDFNKKFFVPFKLAIKNQVDVMLNNELPTISFKFQDRDIEELDLLKVLSQGEKRALYILNILFEIEARKNKNKDCLLVIDDIADSFDYKNKYAIIEYLKEISDDGNFYLIILSHNFDFYRSVSSRLDMPRDNRLHVSKFEGNIKLEEEIYQNSPLNYWREHLDDEIMLLASIPFIRNLFEYSGKKDLLQNMTNFLHIKSNTKDLTIGNLKEYYNKILNESDINKIENEDDKFYDFLTKNCKDIISKHNIKLEDKIVLSMGIRLQAENFMIRKINDKSFVESITKSQTAKLFGKYKKLFIEDEHINLLEQVRLMTPENIHLNSFMYEPILDMSGEHLKRLYQNILDIQTH